MRYFFSKLFLVICLFSETLLHGQLDPAAMSTLSKLSPDQRQQLIKQYGSSGGGLPKSVPTAQMPSRSVKTEKPEEESFDDRTDFLGDLNSMERMISADVSRLQSQVNREDSSEDNELLEALEESKALLRKIKALQRREIEKRAEEFGKSETDAIKPFGYDLFASDPSTFAPGNEVPIPSDYRIGPGDLIEIQLFGQRNDSFSLGISREGMLRFPGIGPIHAFEQGTTFLELKNHLKEKIREHLGEGVQSSITLGAFRSIRIFLLGEVRKQGAYTVSALSTTINALLSCGGIKESGSLRKIQLKRAGKIVSTLDLYDLLLLGDTSADKALQPGDVIFVPVVEHQITISGAVKRPAKYEILTEESLEEIIEVSGGVTGRAYLSNIRLERLGEDYRPFVKNLSLPSDSRFKILPGDIISISSASSEVSNSISLIGNVERPGEYEWKAGMKLKDIIAGIDDLLPKTDMHYGLIRRKLQDGTIKVIHFSPSALFSKGHPSPIHLQKEDALYFFSVDQSRNNLINGILDDLKRQRTLESLGSIISVSGLVRFPGEYPLTENMALADLLDASGGLLDAAYSVSAEISRMTVDGSRIASIDHITISDLSDNNHSNTVFFEPYDHLHIKRVPYWSENQTITLSGEFLFPGTYRIFRGESLSEVVKRAGGFTEHAFPYGAIFTREHIRRKESVQKEQFVSKLENMIAYENLEKSNTSDDSVLQQSRALISRLRSIPSTGRLVIDLESQLSNSADTEILLLDGDTLFVPKVPQEVTVSGEVQFPTSHLADNSLSMLGYIEHSGGFTDRSDEKRIALVKSNGMVISQTKSNAWFSPRKTSLDVAAGDMIIVPVKIELPSKWLENLATSTQIMYQIALSAAAINSF
jgi:polysaccharide export outer membrane protein